LSKDPIFGKLVASEAVAPTRWFLEAFPGLSGQLSKLIDLPLIRACLESIENLTIPGISIHIALRKCWFEEQVLKLINRGCSQVIVLGAGFDTLAYRLHRQFPGVRWWEIDHPATQQVKSQALDQHGQVAQNLILTPVDFEQQTLHDTLEQLPDYNIHAATLFIAEGLLMYLTEAEVKKLLQDIYLNSGPNTYLVGSLLKPDTNGQLVISGSSPLVDLRLQLMGEPYRWGLASTDMSAFFTEYGFKPLETVNAKQIITHYLPNVEGSKVTLPEGEYFFWAERMNMI
jgi:methyltransferase (TIGR00027 family)